MSLCQCMFCFAESHTLCTLLSGVDDRDSNADLVALRKMCSKLNIISRIQPTSVLSSVYSYTPVLACICQPTVCIKQKNTWLQKYIYMLASFPFSCMYLLLACRLYIFTFIFGIDYVPKNKSSFRINYYTCDGCVEPD